MKRKGTMEGQLAQILNKTDSKSDAEKLRKKDRHLKREGQKGGNLTNFGCYSERREIIRRGISV